jgi:hypothetical protein
MRHRFQGGPLRKGASVRALTYRLNKLMKRAGEGSDRGVSTLQLARWPGACAKPRRKTRKEITSCRG